MHIRQIDRALKWRSQRVVINLRMVTVGIKQPFAAHVIRCEILQTSISQVIKEREHSPGVRTVDIGLDGSAIAITRDDIRPAIHRLRRGTCQRVMMFPMPILELDIVDMIPIEVVKNSLDLVPGHIPIRRQESIPGEPTRFGRHINTNRCDHRVTSGHRDMQGSHIPAKILRRRLPNPRRGGDGLFLYHLPQIGITHRRRLFGQ